MRSVDLSYSLLLIPLTVAQILATPCSASSTTASDLRDLQEPAVALLPHVAKEAGRSPASDWWTDRAPDFGGPVAYRPSRLAVQSPGCENVGENWEQLQRWRAARDRCWRRGYEGAHVYVSLVREERSSAHNIYLRDPWRHDPVTRDRVHHIVASSAEEVLVAIRRIIQSCQVVKYLYVDAHGSPGTIATSETHSMPVGEFLRDVISPCALAPRARVQFSSCQVACGNHARMLESELSAVFGNRNYVPDRNPAPFEDLRVQLNTSDGLVFPGLSLGSHPVISPFVTSENGIRVEFVADAFGEFRSNVPHHLVPACGGAAAGN